MESTLLGGTLVYFVSQLGVIEDFQWIVYRGLMQKSHLKFHDFLLYDSKMHKNWFFMPFLNFFKNSVRPFVKLYVYVYAEKAEKAELDC